MVEQHRVAARCAFIEQLNELCELAGSPTLSELRRLSVRVDGGGGRRRELAESTTNDILTGKRKRVPDWSWVASFVIACHMAAEQTHLDVRELGSLQDWNARWRAARTPQPSPAGSAPAGTEAAAQAGPPVVPRTIPPVEPYAMPPGAPRSVSSIEPYAEPPVELYATPSAMPSAGRRTARPQAATGAPPPMSGPTQRHLEIYGRTGARLLQRTDADDGRACMRLAVIALLRDWPEEAHQWLRRANDAGHADAPGLFNHPHRCAAAAELAYRYGREYQSATPAQVSVAMFFYRLAGECGHAEAAYELAVIHQRQDEDWAAAAWFNRAAGHGHPHAAAKFNGVSAQISHAPWNADGVLPVGLIEAPTAVLRPPPATGEPPVA
ncbi:hypothetical protein ACWDS7_03920, partial [Streptosporangium sp. NPDC003464]